MLNILLFIGCLAHSKPKVEYTIIGTVDKAEKGICTIEIHDALFHQCSPTTIHVYSHKCKEGDVLAVGRKNGTKD